MLDNQPKVSIITPVFNRADIVHKTIDSVIGQTYQNWELLLVDDGSTDNIEEVIANKYASETRISFTRRNRGPKSASTCRNIGAEKAISDYLIFLDSDDLLEKHCLEQRVNVMLADPGLDFAVFRFQFLNHLGGYVLNDFDNGKDPLINFLSNKSYWAIMCPIWKKSAFFEIGGFNVKFSRYQDPEIHIRAITYPGIKYQMCMDLPPDTMVIPSIKKQSVLFAADINESLNILIPQTYGCLEKVKKTEYIKYMDGYLKEWLIFFAFTNFNDTVCDMTKNIILLFQKYGVIESKKANIYRLKIKVVTFVLKAIKWLFINLTCKR